MKYSIALTCVLLLAIGALGWRTEGKLAEARETHRRLSAEAADMGISTRGDGGAQDIRRERADRSAEARRTARDVIAFSNEMKKKHAAGGPQPVDPETQEKTLELLDRIAALDAAGMKAFIDELKADPSLTDQERQGLIGFSVMMLANDHPLAALTLFTESAGSMEDSPMTDQVIRSALFRLATDSPEAAVEWMRKNGAIHPDLVTDQVKRAIIQGAAANDPALAFKLITELEIAETSGAMVEIARVAKTPAQRDRVLAAWREYQKNQVPGAKPAENQTDLFPQLAREAAKDGFEAGSRWLDNAKLREDELADLADGSFTSQVKGADTGRWVEWLGRTLPEGKADQGIRNMVDRWTQTDHQAAADWLDTLPEGNTRNSSIQAYAEAVSKYEPEAAVEWAELMPAGKSRDTTLRRIYRNWPDRDNSPAAAEFATKHGLKK